VWVARAVRSAGYGQGHLQPLLSNKFVCISVTDYPDSGWLGD